MEERAKELFSEAVQTNYETDDKMIAGPNVRISLGLLDPPSFRRIQ